MFLKDKRKLFITYEIRVVESSEKLTMESHPLNTDKIANKIGKNMNYILPTLKKSIT
jgi:hypothetical protein